MHRVLSSSHLSEPCPCSLYRLIQTHHSQHGHHFEPLARYNNSWPEHSTFFILGLYCTSLCLSAELYKQTLSMEHNRAACLLRLSIAVFPSFLRVVDTQDPISSAACFSFIAWAIAIPSVFREIVVIIFLFSVIRLYIVSLLKETGCSTPSASSAYQ